MSERSLSVSVPEAVCANAALVRNLLTHFIRVGAITAEELDALFVFTKKDLAGGLYDAANAPGAQAYLDHLQQSMDVRRIVPQSTLTH